MGEFSAVINIIKSFKGTGADTSYLNNFFYQQKD